jgi:hypothetical protein
VVKIATQQNVKEVEIVPNHTSKEIHKTLQSTKNSVVEDWANDDDIFEEIPNLSSKVVPEINPYPKTSSLISQQEQHLSALKEKSVHQLKNKEFLENTINTQGNASSSLKSQQSTQSLKPHNEPVIEKGPAKFPGPAGLFNLSSVIFLFHELQIQ